MSLHRQNEEAWSFPQSPCDGDCDYLTLVCVHSSQAIATSEANTHFRWLRNNVTSFHVDRSRLGQVWQLLMQDSVSANVEVCFSYSSERGRCLSPLGPRRLLAGRSELLKRRNGPFSTLMSFPEYQFYSV